LLNSSWASLGACPFSYLGCCKIHPLKYLLLRRQLSTNWQLQTLLCIQEMNWLVNSAGDNKINFLSFPLVITLGHGKKANE